MSVYNGKSIRFELFGASHAESVGVRAVGLPAGERVDLGELMCFLKRRAPGQSELTSPRAEPDEPIIISGLTDGVTDGRVFEAKILNINANSRDYVNNNRIPRPGHADYTAVMKYGRDFDLAGGGVFSGRMTAPLCILGGVLLQLLSRRGIKVFAHAEQIGSVLSPRYDAVSPMQAEEMTPSQREELLAAKRAGDSVGGIIECAVTGLPVGLGAEQFDGLESRIAALVFGVPAVKGVDFGAGFRSAAMRGSEFNDAFEVAGGRVVTATNNCGGILGGISDGMPLIFRAAIKPTPSIAREQQSVDLETLTPQKLSTTGRHDPCIVPRAIPVVEAAAAIAIADELFADIRGDSLSELRRGIDHADAEIAEAFSRRMKLVSEVAVYKEANGLPTLDSERERQKLAEMPEELQSLYAEIFRISREHQDEVRK